MRFDEQGRKKSGLSGGGECLGRRRKGEGEGEGERERERERERGRGRMKERRGKEDPRL